MRLLFCGINYAPDFIGVPKFNAELCEWLQSRGNEIHVVTAPPYYPAWTIPEEYRTWAFRSEKRNDILVKRAPIFVPRSPSGPKRLLHHASFAVTSAWPIISEAYRWRPHILMAVAPSLISCALIAWVSRCIGAKSWLHLQDFEVDAAFDFGLLGNSSLRKFMLAVERGILRSFDNVSTISPQMLRRLSQKGVGTENIYELRNWADIEKISPGQRIIDFRKLLGLSDSDIVVLYSGTMSNKQGLDLIIEAAKELEQSHSHVRFVLSGDGPQKSRLEEMALGLTNVQFVGLQADDCFGQLLRTADFHVLPQRIASADLVLPSKVGNMLASGRPVIAVAGRGTALADEVEGAGIVVDAGCRSALIEALKALAENTDLRQALGAKARERAELCWNKAVILRSLEQRLVALCNQDKATKTPQLN